MSIKKIALYAFILNLCLAIMKAALAAFSNSLAVTAGAIDSGTDSVASLVLYAGLHLSTRESPSFPLGLYKIENFISIVVALFIFFAGYEIAQEVIAPAEPRPDMSISVILLLLVGTLATWLFGRYALTVGRRTESPTLIAEGRHRQVDVVSSLVVLASAVLGFLDWDFAIFGIHVDQIAAGVVLVFIARAGWGLLADGMRVLLDASIDFDTLARIRKILEDHPMVVEIQSLIGRSAGRFRFLQASVTMRTGDLRKAHEVSENLERLIREKVRHVHRVTIHYEPQPRTDVRIAVPLADTSGKVSDHFGSAPYFAIVTIRLSDFRVESEEIFQNPHSEVETAKGIRVAEWLVRHKVDRVCVKEDLSQKGPGYVFGNAGVKMIKSAAKDLEETIENFKQENGEENLGN